MRHPVAIIGAGLAGLVAARLLHKAGIDFALFEARERLGGRILSTEAPGGEIPGDGFDLGPSWIWPAMQPAIGSLVEELGLTLFPQNGEGDMLFERSPVERPGRYGAMAQEPPSMRIAGGTGALVRALARALPQEAIHVGAAVTRISREPAKLVLAVEGAGPGEKVFAASRAILALPPRLIEAGIAFTPGIEPATARRWRETPTWMAPHAKFFAVYPRAFWREKSLSGMAQSMVGPLVEIHDATTASGTPALFGFLGIGAERRAALSRDAIAEASLAQLARLFGAEAEKPRATLYKDWAMDPLTATADDRTVTSHPLPGGGAWIGGEWARFIALAGSETSADFPGYLAGAVDAAYRAVSAAVAGLDP